LCCAEKEKKLAAVSGTTHLASSVGWPEYLSGSTKYLREDRKVRRKQLAKLDLEIMKLKGKR
jgi:hypothetical protein